MPESEVVPAVMTYCEDGRAPAPAHMPYADEGQEPAGATDAGKIRPNELAVGKGHLQVVSMGFLVEDEEQALMWRGLMLSKALEQFLTDVGWGPMDYLLVDMPPGTGDIQMALSRLLPQAEMLVVTTPAVGAAAGRAV